MVERVSLPILTLETRDQKYSCHACGLCCRDFTVQLRDEDIRKLDEQKWDDEFGHVPYLEFRGQTWLRQRKDGSCVFLLDDGRCRIHAEHGFREKPLACQLFPFAIIPGERGQQIGLSFACPSVVNNRGAGLDTHWKDVRRMARALGERTPPRHSLTLEGRTPLDAAAVDAINRSLDRWMLRDDLDIETRLEGLALLTATLRDEKLSTIVEGGKLGALFDQLLDAAPDEMGERPAAAPTARQLKQLRQRVFAHVEDPKIPTLGGRFAVRRRAFQQLRINRRFSRGRGATPVPIGADWPAEVPLESVDTVDAARDPETIAWFDSLMTRYVRARVHGGRAFGPGYYGFSVLDGLDSLWLDLAVTGWLARHHAAGMNRATIEARDIEAALIRVDRAAGRAPWLGSRAERLRLQFLTQKEGVRRLRRSWRMTD
ncbi:MAG: YkgJ family cysteine cluster protein [Phycisphaerales bacterium]